MIENTESQNINPDSEFDFYFEFPVADFTTPDIKNTYDNREVGVTNVELIVNNNESEGGGDDKTEIPDGFIEKLEEERRKLDNMVENNETDVLSSDEITANIENNEPVGENVRENVVLSSDEITANIENNENSSELHVMKNSGNEIESSEELVEVMNKNSENEIESSQLHVVKMDENGRNEVVTTPPELI
jgi:hypothetical protein